MGYVKVFCLNIKKNIVKDFFLIYNIANLIKKRKNNFGIDEVTKIEKIKEFTMEKERLVTFTDAVLAIIMTILVLELKKPTEPTLAQLWALRESFLAYALSFFWLGSMWIALHNTWS